MITKIKNKKWMEKMMIGVCFFLLPLSSFLLISCTDDDSDAPLTFYSSVRLDIRRVTSIKDGDQILGNQVRVKVVKNKVAPPFRKAEFEITFGEGINKVGEILDLGVEYDLVQKSGSWFSYNGAKLAQGREATKNLLKDNPELCEELEKRIKEAIAARAEK